MNGSSSMIRVPPAIRALGIVSLMLAVLSASCTKKGEIPPDATKGTPTQKTEVRSVSEWKYQSAPHASTAVIFVHGIFGHSDLTWRRPGMKSLFDYLHEQPAVGEHVDIFTFAYPSHIALGGSQTIQEAAKQLISDLKFYGASSYQNLVFVAHSMGGLVVLRALQLDQQEDLIAKTPLLVFYSAPMEGAEIAKVADYVLDNPGLKDMMPDTLASHNTLLEAIEIDWKQRDAKLRPVIACGYEIVQTKGVVVVGKPSSTRYCDNLSIAISEDHLGVVKPTDAEHASVKLLVNALLEVLPEPGAKRYELPDFSAEGGKYTFILNQARRSARLVNRMKTKLRFTFSNPNGADLILLPGDAPRIVEGLGQENLEFGLLFTAEKDEYLVKLAIEGEGELDILVKIPDMPAMRARQSDLINRVFTKLEGAVERAALTSPGSWEISGGPSSDATKVDATIALVTGVRDAILEANPKATESMQWVLAADLLTAANWPELASLALKNSVREAPGVANLSAVQRLETYLAHRTGTQRILSKSGALPVPSAEDEQAFASSSAKFISLANQSRASTVADKLKTSSELSAYGYRLAGDVKIAKGDVQGAIGEYKQAKFVMPELQMKERINSVRLIETRPDVEKNPQINFDNEKYNKQIEELLRNDKELRGPSLDKTRQDSLKHIEEAARKMSAERAILNGRSEIAQPADLKDSSRK